MAFNIRELEEAQKRAQRRLDQARRDLRMVAQDLRDLCLYGYEEDGLHEVIVMGYVETREEFIAACRYLEDCVTLIRKANTDALGDDEP